MSAPEAIQISAHALSRARSRWLEPDDAAAYAAIRYVLRRGTVAVRGSLTTYALGHRVVRVRGGAVVTVVLRGQSYCRAIRGQARRDLNERKRGRTP